MSDTDTMTETASPSVGVPMDETSDLVRQARELIPVSQAGVTPVNFAQQIDYAQAMAKARSAIPKHLQGNVGDCLAIIDIASRASMSPYMLAAHSYIQNNILCFDSQAYHALAQASGLLDGDLVADWKGDGDELVCVVSCR